MLVCLEWDYDTFILGEGDLLKARTLMTNPELELQPDKKLTQPNMGGIIEDILL